jgi:hypothetical protein
MTDHQDNPAGPLSFELDIRPLFRDKDRNAMLKAFDLWSYADVMAHQDAILDQVRGGHMPCDGAWPAGQVAILDRWAAQGSAP